MPRNRLVSLSRKVVIAATGGMAEGWSLYVGPVTFLLAFPAMNLHYVLINENSIAAPRRVTARGCGTPGEPGKQR